MVARVVSIARGQFFFGWIIVAVGAVIQLVSGGMAGYGQAVFLKPMCDELGWNRATFTGATSFGSVVSGLISPFLGPILDKRGGRDLMIVGAVIFGAALALTGLVQGLPSFYLIRGVVWPIAISCIGSLTVNIMISNWFVRKRGKAIAVANMGMSFSSIALVPLVVYLVATFGWRWAWVVLGVGVWIVLIPPTALFVKRRPEDIGLLPDGDKVNGRNSEIGQNISNPVLPQSDRHSAPLGENTWTRREAMRSSSLWLVIVACGLGTLGASVIGYHFVPFLTDIGLSAGTMVAILGIQSVTSFVAKVFWGIAIDRSDSRTCGIAAFALSGGGMAIVTMSAIWPSFWLALLGAVLSGLTLGGMMIVQEVIWASYFGRLSLGTVRAIASPFTIVFAAGGPFFAGWVFDNFGSYLYAWAASSGGYAVAAVLIYFSRPPRKSPAPEPENIELLPLEQVI